MIVISIILILGLVLGTFIYLESNIIHLDDRDYKVVKKASGWAIYVMYHFDHWSDHKWMLVDSNGHIVKNINEQPILYQTRNDAINQIICYFKPIR